MSSLVSVIIPTIDRPEELLRAVDSVVKQTYDEIEIVIIEEGGSEPNVPSLLRSNGIDLSDIVHLFNEEPSGLAAARNQAAERANGEYLAFLDDDDEWYPDKIEKQVSRLDDTGLDICYTGVERIGPHGELRSTTIPDVEGDARPRALRGSIIGPSVFMLSFEAFDTVGGFDDEIPYWEDWDFFLRLSKEYYFTGVHETLTKTHAGADDRLSDSFELAKQGGEYLLNKHCPIEYDGLFSTTRRFKSRVWQGVGRSALMNGHYSDSRRFFRLSLRQWPFDTQLIIYTGLSIGGRPVLNLVKKAKREVVIRKNS